MSLLSTLSRQLLHQFSPETAHNIAIKALQYGLVPGQKTPHYKRLATELWGLKFANIIGLAAGFDKNAQAMNGLAKQGFGFLEVGTVTPKPQEGNPQPRLFRLQEDAAIINRMGFNNAGAEIAREHLLSKPSELIIGSNIGKNKSSKDAVKDYVTMLEKFYEVSDYITVNISSPNTKGLRDLQEGKALEKLLKTLDETRNHIRDTSEKNTPILLKIAPDCDSDTYKHITDQALKHHFDGMIISNTTISRPETLQSVHKEEAGGLSGKILLPLANEALNTVYKHSGGTIPLIGVGGIASAEDAYAKIKAGASLIQLYSALIYQGFELVNEIATGLDKLLEADGFSHVSEAVGT